MRAAASNITRARPRPALTTRAAPAGHRFIVAVRRCNEKYAETPPAPVLDCTIASPASSPDARIDADFPLRRPRAARRQEQGARVRRHRPRLDRLRSDGNHGKRRHRGQRARPDHRSAPERPRRHRLAGSGDPRALRANARRPRDGELDDHVARPGRRLGPGRRQGVVGRRRPADRAAAPARAGHAAHAGDDRANDVGPSPGRHLARLPCRCARAGSRERRNPGGADGAQPDDRRHRRADAAARRRRPPRVAAARYPSGWLALPAPALPAAAERALDRGQGACGALAGTAARACRQRADDQCIGGLERDARGLEPGSPATRLGARTASRRCSATAAFRSRSANWAPRPRRPRRLRLQRPKSVKSRRLLRYRRSSWPRTLSIPVAAGRR